MKLLVLLFAFTVSRYVPGLVRLRCFVWYRWWVKKSQQWFPVRYAEWLVLLIVGVPVIVISTLLSWLVWHNHVLELLVSTLVVAYCLGPDSVMAEVESLQNEVNRQTASEQPGERAEESDLEAGRGQASGHFDTTANVVEYITTATLERWFAVFFWFLVLGTPGALLYRLTERLTRYVAKEPLAKTARVLKQILEYPVSWLMVLALAVVSDFEKIWEIKKRYLNWDNISQLQQRFLYQSMEFAVANCLGADDSECQVSALERAARMTWRMLVVWFVMLSLLVIAGF